MDCPYCGKTIEDGGFICANCSTPEKTDSVVSKDNDSIEKPNSPPVDAVKTPEIEPKTPAPIVTKKQSPKPITKEAEKLPTTIEPENSKPIRKEKQVVEKISLSEATEQEQSSQAARSSDKWKQYTIHPDLTSHTSVLLIGFFLLIVNMILIGIFMVVLQNGPRYAAIITGLFILILFVLPVFIQIDEMRVKKWKRFASWVYNNGLREKATYEIKIHPNNAGGSITVRILKLSGGSIEDNELHLLSKAPRRLALGFGNIIPHFIESSSDNIISEADIIYDPDTIKHGLILERNGHRIWLSTTKFNAPV